MLTYVVEDFFAIFVGKTFHFLQESCNQLAKFSVVPKTFATNEQMIVFWWGLLGTMLILQESFKILTRVERVWAEVSWGVEVPHVLK